MANKKKNDNVSVIKILKAAEEIFSEKGFDGARVDDIAARAEVNKSHIYYHFESKEELLEEICKRHLKEILEEKEAVIGDAQEVSADLIEKMFRNYLMGTLSKRKKFLSIIMIEVMKSASSDTSLFSILERLTEDAVFRFQKMGYQLDVEDFKTNIFYFVVMPVIIHLTIGDKWADFIHRDKENLDSAFMESLKNIYNHYLCDKKSKDPGFTVS